MSHSRLERSGSKFISVQKSFSEKFSVLLPDTARCAWVFCSSGVSQLVGLVRREWVTGDVLNPVFLPETLLSGKVTKYVLNLRVRVKFTAFLVERNYSNL